MDKIWYQELGFFSNPFSIKPAAFHNEVFGNLDVIDGVLESLKDRGLVFVSGDFGAGKTTVLKRIIGEYSAGDFGAKRIIYYNCNSSEEPVDYDSLLVGASGFFGRLFGFRRRGMMLLLDEAQDMKRRDFERVKEYYDNGFFRSVVFVSRDDDIDLTEELDLEVGENRFVLGDMSKSEAVKMVRKRIGDLKFISDDVILKIFERDSNSRSFLKNCEDVCRVAFEDGVEEVGVEYVKKVLG